MVTEITAERRDAEGRVHTGEVVDVAPGLVGLTDTSRQPEDGHGVDGQDVAHMLVQVEVLQQEPATERTGMSKTDFVEIQQRATGVLHN